MLVIAWQQVTPSTIEACFRKCLEDPKVQIDPVPVPPDFTRSAWESQIDLEEFTEEEIELEIQEIIQKNQSMAPDPAELEKENLMTTTVAMVRILTSSGWKPAECKPDNIKHDYETDEDEFDLNQCFVEPPSIVITPRKRRAEDNYSGTSQNCRPRLFK